MSKAQDEISELLALQREATKKPPRRRKAAAKKKPAEPVDEPEAAAPAEEIEEPATEDTEGPKGPRSEIEAKMKELSDNIESAVEEIENSAKEQPVLMSLVAFTLGLVVGQSLSRR